MRKNKALIIFLFAFLTLVCSINIVFAEDPDINLLDLPEALGDQLGISTFSAGMLLTALLIFPFDMCLILWKKGGIIAVIFNFVLLGFFTSIGWIPNWTVLLVGLIVAGLYATKIKEMM